MSAAAWALFTPLVMWLARRLRIGRRNLASRIVIHAVLAVGVATAHVAIVRASGFMAFGDSSAFRRTVSYDTQLKRALELLRNAGTQRELLAAATQPHPRSE